MDNQRSTLLLKMILTFLLVWQLHISSLAQPYSFALKAARQANELNQPQMAVAALKSSLDFAPNQPETWSQLAASYQAAGDLPSAIAAFEKADSLEPLDTAKKSELADLYMLAGNNDAAYTILSALAQDPQPDATVYDGLVTLQKQNGELDLARETLLKWTGEYPSDASALYQLGILSCVDDPGLALTSLARAAEADPQFAYAYEILKPALLSQDTEHPAYNLVMLGRALGMVNEWEMAAKAFQTAVDIETEFPEALAFLSEALYQTGRDGSRQIEQALVINPDSIVANAIHAVQQRRLGNPDIALSALYRAAAQEPAQGIWQLEIANTLIEMDAVAEAFPHLKTAVLLEPQNIQFWKALSDFCAATGIHLRDEGLPAARKVMLLAPDNPDSFDTMGRSLAALGDFENAIRYYQAAISRNPAHANAHLHLAQVYLNLGKSQLALEHLSLAQSYAIQDPDTMQTATRLMERYFGTP